MRDFVTNIKNQEFTKSFRGYNTEEIDSYLDQLSYECEKLVTKNKKLETGLAEANAELEATKIKVEELQIEREQLKSDAVAVIEATKAESAVVLKDAQSKAEQLVENAKQDADRIRRAVINLREEKHLLIARLKAIIETQNEVLENRTGSKSLQTVETEEKKSAAETNINVEDIVEKLL